MSIVLSHLSFTFPSAPKPIISDVTASFSARLTGLVGDNGSGKTTLLRLLTGQLTPSAGDIKTNGRVGYLPQDIVRHDKRTIAELLGIKQVLDALDAIESGTLDPGAYDTVGTDWDIADRAQAVLAKIAPSLGTPCDLQRSAATLSGGEILRVALAGLQLRDFQTLVLDEPTNNLDTASRQDFYNFLQGWKSQIVVVSHDLRLLELVDEIAELRQGNLRLFTGSYRAYKAAIDSEQAAAARDVADAQREKRLARKTRINAQIKMDRAVRAGKKAKEQRKFPHKQAGLFAAGQQQSQAKVRRGLEASKTKAQTHLDEAQTKLRDDDTAAITLPDPKLASARDVAELHHAGGVIYLRGPERILIEGDNGSGKTQGSTSPTTAEGSGLSTFAP